ncbi:MAG TPA: hypothetical protein VH277_02010 [Gemmatimonadaceae bacterium]|nr:hypothetical protein [Gemmatimonadaceae bacterium]
MRHALLYNGAYESNYDGLKPGARTYNGTEGGEHPLTWPDEIDGVRIGYMERTGKKFYAVRVQYGDHDVVLENPVHVDAERHLNARRFSANPMRMTDDEASALLDDIIRDNPDKQPELAMMINKINQVRRAGRQQQQTES